VDDTWTTRDLPVLDATVSLLEQSYMVTVSDIAARTGLEISAVARALEALDPAYVDFRKTTTGGDPTFWYVFKATPAARQVVGQWPTAESLVTRLAEELRAAAAAEPEVDRRGLLIYAARLIGDTLHDVAVQAATEVLSASGTASWTAPDGRAPGTGAVAEPVPAVEPRAGTAPAEEPVRPAGAVPAAEPPAGTAPAEGPVRPAGAVPAAEPPAGTAPPAEPVPPAGAVFPAATVPSAGPARESARPLAPTRPLSPAGSGPPQPDPPVGG
jgi:predicted transcriptional regulator